MSVLRRVTCKIQGVRPLIMHADTLVDQTSEKTLELKALTAKKKKTIDDHRAISKLEWYAGLYLNTEGKPVVPAANLEKAISQGAARLRKGKEITACCVIDSDALLIHDHPLGSKATPDDLWIAGDDHFVDKKSMVVNRSRVMRTRPMFRRWELEFTAILDEVDVQDFLSYVHLAGRFIGLCDSRPRYGRFKLVNYKEATVED